MYLHTFFTKCIVSNTIRSNVVFEQLPLGVNISGLHQERSVCRLWL